MEKNYLMIKNKPKYYIFILLYIFLFPIAKLLYGRKNNWLVCERGTDAQDNGYVFYKFLVKFHPEIKSIYLIDKKSPDYKKVSAIGKTVQFGSFKHFLLVIGCHVKISSHLYGYSPWVALSTFYRRNHTRDKHVFLQHGITKNYHLGLSRESCKSLNLFICGAKPEYDYILKEFHYHNSVPQYTGLPRYDFLNNANVKNQIIIMPTWRANLVNMTDDEFLRTKYFLCWKSVVESEELALISKEKELEIKFYLHNSFQKFSHLFKNNDAIRIITYKDETVQTLLKESVLLITDYSSVFFDFAYLNKPIIYYQFDENDYYLNHYEKGYFDYRKDGFGDVCVNYSDFIKSVLNVINNNFLVSDKYVERVKHFFTFRDTNNCQRVFDSIMRILNER